MPKGLLGKKVGMTQIFDESGVRVPVTVIEAGPCVVLQLRTPEKDGYSGVQLGFGDSTKARKAIRAQRGHTQLINSKRQKERQAAGVELPPKAGCEPKQYVREFRTDGEETGYSVGDTLKADVFAAIPFVDVIGTSKGRGFAGVMKRHNFHGVCASHGVKKVHRMLGSTGQSTDPGKVFKGVKMPGRFGNERVTVRHLKVVKVDPEQNLILVRGAIPGYNGSYVMIRETNCY